MTFSESIKSGFKKYFEFGGRASRSEFWYFYLFTIILSVFSGFIDGVLGWVKASGLGPLGAVATVVTLLPTSAAMVRRLHDTGRSAWWVGSILIGWIIVFFIIAFLKTGEISDSEKSALGLFIIAAIVLSIVVTVFFCLEGEPRSNQYGPSLSGDAIDLVPASRGHGEIGFADYLRASRWVLSGFDSIGNVIRFEFDVDIARIKPLIIGRNREFCDLVISDQGISRRHVEISASSVGVYICDLGSSNGTFLNGQKLTSERVRMPTSGTLMVGPIELSIFGS